VFTKQERNSSFVWNSNGNFWTGAYAKQPYGKFELFVKDVSIPSQIITIPDTTGTTAVGVDLGIVWGVNTFVGKDNQLIWNVNTFVGKSLQLVWNIFAFVNKVLQLIWNVRKAVAGQYLDTILGALNTTFDTDITGWASTGGSGTAVTWESTDKALKVARVTSSFPTARNTFSDIACTGSKIISFRARSDNSRQVFISVAGDGSTQFDVFNTLPTWQTYQGTFVFDGTTIAQIDVGFNESASGTEAAYFDDIKIGTSLSDLDFTWNTKTFIGKSLQSIWNTAAIAGKSAQFVWNVAAAIGKSAQFIWNTLANATAVGKDLQLVWNTRAAIGKDSQFIWNTRVLIGKSNQFIWNINTPVGKILQFIWLVRAALGKSEQLIWNTGAATGKSNQLIWNTKVRLHSIDLNFVWNVLTVVSSSPRQFIWNTRSNAGKDLTIVWNTFYTFNWTPTPTDTSVWTPIAIDTEVWTPAAQDTENWNPLPIGAEAYTVVPSASTTWH
jgi:hypothetical protein